MGTERKVPNTSLLEREIESLTPVGGLKSGVNRAWPNRGVS